MTYPTGTRIQWRPDIPHRPGQQSGVLSRDWHRFAEFPRILWDGEEHERQELPECVCIPGEMTLASTSTRNAWNEVRQ